MSLSSRTLDNLALGQPWPRLLPDRGHGPLPHERRCRVAGRSAGSDPGVPGEQPVTDGRTGSGEPWFPALTTVQRRQASRRAVAARGRRARARRALKAGQVTLAELLEAAGDDPVLARMRVRDLLLGAPTRRAHDSQPGRRRCRYRRLSASAWPVRAAAQRVACALRLRTRSGPWQHGTYAAASSSCRVWGKVSVLEGARAWQARTYVRDADGVRRQVRAQAPTKAGARQALARALSGGVPARLWVSWGLPRPLTSSLPPGWST